VVIRSDLLIRNQTGANSRFSGRVALSPVVCDVMSSSHQTQYVIWQNRAFTFYLAARVLYHEEIFGPAAFNANQALELMLKATLAYHDSSFNPTAVGHRFASLLRALGNKVKNGSSIHVPEYFYSERRYQSVSRYPEQEMGVLVPSSFLVDLDQTFSNLLRLVPFQHNTLLKRTLANPSQPMRKPLTRNNSAIPAIRQFLRALDKAPNELD